MNRKRGLFFSFFLIVGLYVVYRNYYVEGFTDMFISSEMLIESFHNNEVLSNKKYVGKVIEIDGMIEGISFANERITILLEGNHKNSFVLCDMKLNQYQYVEKLEKGEKIIVKGTCKGFLHDVILLNCIIINTGKKMKVPK